MNWRRLLPALTCAGLLLTTSTACLRSPRMSQPEGDVASWAGGFPKGDEATVAPLAFAANEYKACLVVGGLSCKETYTMVYSAFLVKTRGHTFLIDAGLGANTDAWMAMFPAPQRKALNLHLERTLSEELARFSVTSEQLAGVVVTHAHWDHLAGLSDLPRAKVFVPQTEVDWIESLGNRGHDKIIRSLMGLRTVDVQPFAWDGPAVLNFPASHDLFGDGSVILLPIPGHTPGSTAVFLPNVGGKPVLFVGDTVWNRDGYVLPAHKPRLTSRAVDADRKALSQSIQRLKALSDKFPNLVIVPAHDLEAWEEVKKLSKPWEIPAK